MHDEEDALHPALALLQKVPEGEGRFFPHLAVDPVERVALGHGRHGEVGVLGDASFNHMSMKTDDAVYLKHELGKYEFALKLQVARLLNS